MDKRWMNCTRCELCGTSNLIYSHPFIEYSILFRLLTAPLASMGYALLSSAILKSNGPHSNTKVLLIGMTVSTIIANIGILADALYKFFVSNVMPADMQCDYQVFYPQYFIGIRNVQEIGTTCMALSTIFLAIERTAATVFYRSYEKLFQLPIFGLFLVIIQILCCVIPVLYVHIPKQMYPYTSPEIQNYKMNHYFSMCLSLTNLTAVLIFINLWIVNRYRLKLISNNHLQVVLARYELTNNISTTTLMMPIAIIIPIMVFSGEIILAFFTPIYDSTTIITTKVLIDITEYAPIAEYQLTIIPTLSIAILILMPLCCEKLKESLLCVSNLRLCFKSKLNTNTRSSSESSEVYFGKTRWNSKINQTNPSFLS